MKLSDRNEAEQFVSTLFLGVLHREADLVAREHFVGQLLNGRSPASVADAFVGCDEFKTKNAIKMFVPAGHFYSPIVDPAKADRHLERMESKGLPETVPGISIDRSEMVNAWRSLQPYLAGIPFPEVKAPGYRYAFSNPNYGWGDGSVLNAMLRL